MAQIGIAQTGITSNKPTSGGGGAPTTDNYVLGAQDAVNLPNSVAIPGLYGGPDVQPASPGTLDDEFPGTSLSGSWTQKNLTGVTTKVGGSYLQMVKTGTAASGPIQIARIVKTAPATPWTVIAKFSGGSDLASGAVFGSANKQFGLHLEDGTGKILGFVVWWESTTAAGIPQLQIERLNSQTSFSAFSATLGPFGAAWSGIWLKIQDDGTNLIYSYSLNGVIYHFMFKESRTAWLSAGPTLVGIGLDNEEVSTVNLSLVCDYFRRTQ